MKRPRAGWLTGAAAMAAATAVLGASPALAAASFTNGNFESGNYTAPAWTGFETLYAGSATASAMTGWTVTSGSVDWITTYWASPFSGTMNSVDMNGTASAAQPNPAGVMSQAFASAADDDLVWFYLAGNPACGPSVKKLTVTATGNAPQSYTFSTSGVPMSNLHWTLEYYVFTGASNATTLTFAADPGNTSNCGPAIAGVSVYDYGPPNAVDDQLRNYAITSGQGSGG